MEMFFGILIGTLAILLVLKIVILNLYPVGTTKAELKKHNAEANGCNHKQTERVIPR